MHTQIHMCTESDGANFETEGTEEEAKCRRKMKIAELMQKECCSLLFCLILYSKFSFIYILIFILFLFWIFYYVFRFGSFCSKNVNYCIFLLLLALLFYIRCWLFGITEADLFVQGKVKYQNTIFLSVAFVGHRKNRINM